MCGVWIPPLREPADVVLQHVKTIDWHRPLSSVSPPPKQTKQPLPPTFRNAEECAQPGHGRIASQRRTTLTAFLPPCKPPHNALYPRLNTWLKLLKKTMIGGSYHPTNKPPEVGWPITMPKPIPSPSASCIRLFSLRKARHPETPHQLIHSFRKTRKTQWNIYRKGSQEEGPTN